MVFSSPSLPSPPPHPLHPGPVAPVTFSPRRTRGNWGKKDGGRGWPKKKSPRRAAAAPRGGRLEITRPPGSHGAVKNCRRGKRGANGARPVIRAEKRRPSVEIDLFDASVAGPTFVRDGRRRVSVPADRRAVTRSAGVGPDSRCSFRRRTLWWTLCRV